MTGSPFGSTALHVEQDNRADSLLFDCGYLQSIAERTLIRVRHLFVSHTHFDHFLDFDHLLAAWVRAGRSREELGELMCFGPPGFNQNVRGKLMGYTWNLLNCKLRILSTEIGGDGRPSMAFDSQKKFVGEDAGEAAEPAGGVSVAWEDERLSVSFALLDHRTPSLAYAVSEKETWNIDTDALAASGIEPGPWLSQLKTAARNGGNADDPIETPSGPLPLGRLKKDLLQKSPGDKITFITDTIFNKRTGPLMIELARGSGKLFIETAFLHEDLDKARANHHLTARQAGRIAREAGVRELVQFHFSGRYLGREEEINGEAQAEMSRGD